MAWWSHGCRRRGESEAPAGRKITLDGRRIVDRNSLWYAIGEAVNGPLGQFGSILDALDALDDYLSGGWGAARGCTFDWVDSAEARSGLAELEPSGDGETPFFGVLMDIFEQWGVTVVPR